MLANFSYPLQTCLFLQAWNITTRWQYFGTMLFVLFLCLMREWTRWLLHRVQNAGKFAYHPRDIAIEALCYVVHAVCATSLTQAFVHVFPTGLLIRADVGRDDL
jgi:hypothetical protein